MSRSTITTITVRRDDVTQIAVRSGPDVTGDLVSGQVRLAVDLFALTADNISYAGAGDLLGYWGYFPVGDEDGCVPVWGFADVVESAHAEIAVGERLFGYLPMASHLVVEPSAVGELSFQDATAHRAPMHPWYNRYYRSGKDPVYASNSEPQQAVLWALFMTGGELAVEMASAVSEVVVSSASSKTSMALAWALRHGGGDVRVVGLTSSGNRTFVERSGVFDEVATYGAPDLDGLSGPSGYVDTAGNPAVTESVHRILGDRLTESILLGRTHHSAGPGTGELVGPAPRFFFIPDVAEAHAAAEGAGEYHARFAAAWHEFLAWTDGWPTVERGVGEEEIVAAYDKVLGGNVGPNAAIVLSWD